ncbi:amidohydrolase/deacetylase family metallohydrolase [Dehalococcoidia bacterium]|nr:amidohydrolase/deacetylase family metallohydrolase [Dehalococcoidia bacterium]
MTYDLLIKGGTVIDPSQGLDSQCDVGILANKIAAVSTGIPESRAKRLVDASGLIVVPGLLDLHVHSFWGVSHYGVDPDMYHLRNGVTTALDAGSSGADTFGAFRKYVLERCSTRLFALLNISSMGMISPDIGELEDLRWADVEAAIRVGQENRKWILGIKVRLSNNITGKHDVESLKKAIDAAEGIRRFVMIHIGRSETPLEKLIELLRPGDVVTHAFTGHPHGILDDAGEVMPSIMEAQDRGVIFDVGHGQGSFSFDVAEKASSQGFCPDNISSDLHAYNIHGPVFDQISVLSKFMWMGMSISDVIRLSTSATARILGVDGRIGTLCVGSEADVTLLRLDEGRFTFTDAFGRSVTSDKKLNHVKTIKDGLIYQSN